MFFDSKKTVAIDIGTSSIKLAELDHTRSGWMLRRFGVVSVNPGWVREGEIVEPQAVSETIRSMVQSLKCKRKHVCSGLFGNAVIIKRISMAPIEENLIAEAVKWEAEQYIPFEINEAAVDYHIINSKNRSPGDNLDVLLVGAKQDYIFRYIEAIESAELKFSIMDVEAFALANCFEVNYGKVPGLVALLDIGAGVSTLVIIENGEVVFTRDSMLGGMTYTSELQKSMGISLPEAESLKISAALGQEVPPEVHAILSSTTEQVVEEIRNAFEFFAATGGGNRITKMFVTGGTVFIPRLVEQISVALGVQFEIFNPFQNIKYDSKNLTAEYVSQIQSISPVALGLGMRQVKES